jgi:hypothetical protein
MSNKKFDAIRRRSSTIRSSNIVTIGVVVDTNDPQQMGRVRAMCPQFGDTDDKLVEHIPWAFYSAPVGGISNSEKRGPNEDSTEGPVAYGFWSIPNVGDRVLVTCIDGNPQMRAWIGCVHGLLMTHTLPHGRYITGTEANKQYGIDGQPSGPLSSSDKPIRPLHGNLTSNFTKPDTGLTTGTPTTLPRNNYEWITRGADYSNARVDRELSKGINPISKVDDNDKSSSKLQGYAVSRSEPHLQNESTDGKNLDSSVYSWTTPGFHSISMDDRPENCRVKIRTTGGHQIIMDDTNERIYINTAEGKSWIEIDQQGNIDIFSDRSISMRANKDINFTAGESIRMYAGQGIHLHSDNDIRLHSKLNTHIKSDQNIRVRASGDLRAESHTDMHIKAGEQVRMSSGSHMNLLSGEVMKMTGGDDVNILSDGMIKMTGGPKIHLNGPAAASAQMAFNAEEQPAFFTSRVPEHEPWPRVVHVTRDKDKKVVGKNGANWDSEFVYNDPNIGKVEWNKPIPRNKKWKR